MTVKDDAGRACGFQPLKWRAEDLLGAYPPEQLARMLAEKERDCKRLEAQCAEKDMVIEELSKMYVEKDSQHQAETKKFQRAKALFFAAYKYVPKSKPGTKGDLIARVVEGIEEWHRERKENFDRWKMPGAAGDLLWLMSRLHPEKFDMTAKSFQDHYRGVCSWPRDAAHQAPARSLYRKVFPEILSFPDGKAPVHK